MDDGLLADAKRHALDTGRSLTQLIQDAVVSLLARERAEQSPRHVKLPVFRGDGVYPGIDIDNSASLLDAMELPGDPPDS